MSVLWRQNIKDESEEFLHLGIIIDRNTCFLAIVEIEF